MAQTNIIIDFRAVVLKEHNLCKCALCDDLVCGDSYSLCSETVINEVSSISYLNKVLCSSCYDFVKEDIPCRS